MARDVVLYGTRSRENFPKHFLLLLLRHYSIHWRFSQLVVLKLTVMSTAKRSKSRAKQFQESWTADVGFVCRMTEQYVHLYKMILRRMKALKRQFLVTKTKQHFKKVVRRTNQSTESSYKVAECIAKREKSFTPLYNAIFLRHANIHFDIN